MAAKDTFHDVVKSALEKDGWTITHEQLHINFAEVDLYIDLGAERLIAAQKDEEKIAVEIKTFFNPSAITDFHTALGQFLNYRFALKAVDPERTLYLAVPSETYDTFFMRRFVQLIIQEYQLKLVVYDSVNEVIVLWQK
ncbi:XisH family protein [Iningainema tapete]|uniref:XisH family protein n=1 Tax=Iningainema tapete BLCC-T55 TaxID=2748662 RepID=A0A8J7C699_9CYAN|nr:XisH family protein [Iningainema tapete]MBD2771751.1 XisH family protein [Iningainema tapete BLCC-T55]